MIAATKTPISIGIWASDSYFNDRQADWNDQRHDGNNGFPDIWVTFFTLLSHNLYPLFILCAIEEAQS